MYPSSLPTMSQMPCGNVLIAPLLSRRLAVCAPFVASVLRGCCRVLFPQSTRSAPLTSAPLLQDPLMVNPQEQTASEHVEPTSAGEHVEPSCTRTDGSGRSGADWTCPRCTFIESSSHAECSMCGQVTHTAPNGRACWRSIQRAECWRRCLRR